MKREEAKRKAEELVDRMSIEEMASQLRYDAPEIEHLDIPEYNWWSEGLHGVARAGTATMFPQAIGLGATFDTELLQAVGRCIGTEARAKHNEAARHGDRDIYKGLTLWSPNVNLFRDPRWGRGQETYGEDPELISRLAVAFIRGLQGEKETLLTAACAKHFAVHSGPEALRHHFDAKASLKEMWETYLPAFEAAVCEAKVESVMGAYNRTNGEPCCAHSYLMEEVLRGQWGFEGHFVSDCWAVRDFHENHKVTGTPEESAALAIRRGCDLNCGCTYQRIMAAYKEGLLKAEDLRRAAIRLFTTRYMLGMFEETEYDAIPYEVVDCPEHRALAARAARESMVLLKNAGILPLSKEKFRTIGVIGPNADSRVALMGNYHGTSARYITVLEGIEDLCGDDVRVLYASGCHLFRDRTEDLAREDDRISEAVTVAEHSDVVVLCLGLDETLEGEEGDTGNSYASGDKPDLAFPEPQQRLMDAVFGCGKPVILLVMSGSALDLTVPDKKAAAVMQVWYPGGRGGREVAKVLFGEAEPTGKLPVTFYRDLSGMPEFTDYSMEGRTYRFLKKKPLYPFGYGLTYGKAEVRSFEVQAEDACFTARATLKNTGGRDTEEVFQVYARAEGTPWEVPNPKLVAFARVPLAAEEEKEITLAIPAERLRVVHADGSRELEGDAIRFYGGFGQPDARTQELTGRRSLCCEVKIQ